MRVLMTADALGGVWTYACELARGLSSLGIRVGLAVMGGELPGQRRAEAAAIPGLELYESEYRLEWMDEPWADLEAAGRWLLRLERRLRPDLVHLNGYAHATLPWAAPVLVVGHSCVLTWWSAVHGERAPARFDRYRRMVREGLWAADAVVTPTAALHRAMVDQYGPVPHGTVIPNGRDPSLFPPGRKDRFFLAVGRLWDEGKNLGLVERAAPELPWPVLVAGTPVHPDTGEREGPRCPPNGVRRLGRLSPLRLARRYAAAPVFVHPARYEPFGLAPLEAALAGSALVLGDIPTLREVWGEAAEYVDPRDAGALAAVLRRLARDDSRRRALARSARGRALRYGTARMAAAYQRLYRQLAADVGAPARRAVGGSP